ncbi:hypothetical protein CEXT_388901 [Caerostris extrusa]|uniref:Uncharacterized protein n=1 Tax=Caerostris extrusa TaxID=172846 RepID=A0AAV4U1A6_CAEEX|nr:hypothetical protein CEXT_388901 [Caerostris extrusa]
MRRRKQEYTIFVSSSLPCVCIHLLVYVFNPSPSNAPETAVIYPFDCSPWENKYLPLDPEAYASQPLLRSVSPPPSLPSHHPFPARWIINEPVSRPVRSC